MIQVYCGSTKKTKQRMLYDSDMYPLGVARVVAKKREDAQRMVKALDGEVLRGLKMKAYFVKPQLKELDNTHKRHVVRSNVMRLVTLTKDPTGQFAKPESAYGKKRRQKEAEKGKNGRKRGSKKKENKKKLIVDQ